MNLAVPLKQNGEYHFEVNADGQLLTCTAFIPMKRDGTDPTCSNGFNVERQEVTTRTADSVTSVSGDSIMALSISGKFAQILVSATRDGVEVLSASLVPQYQGVAINGEGCGECPMAKHTIGG